MIQNLIYLKDSSLVRALRLIITIIVSTSFQVLSDFNLGGHGTGATLFGSGVGIVIFRVDGGDNNVIRTDYLTIFSVI